MSQPILSTFFPMDDYSYFLVCKYMNICYDIYIYKTNVESVFYLKFLRIVEKPILSCNLNVQFNDIMTIQICKEIFFMAS